MPQIWKCGESVCHNLTLKEQTPHKEKNYIKHLQQLISSLKGLKIFTPYFKGDNI